MSERQPLVNALECLLFAAKEPVAVGRLAQVLEVDVTRLPGLLEELQRAREGTGLHVLALAGGYALATRPEYSDHVQRLLEPDPERLSVQALETLAIIAYRQPITRPEVDEVRGVNSSGAVASLVEKNLVRVAGRKDAPGRPFLLETTPHFLSVFGLHDLSDLPELGDLAHSLPEPRLPVGGEAEGDETHAPGPSAQDQAGQEEEGEAGSGAETGQEVEGQP